MDRRSVLGDAAGDDVGPAKVNTDDGAHGMGVREMGNRERENHRSRGAISLLPSRLSCIELLDRLWTAYRLPPTAYRLPPTAVTASTTRARSNSRIHR
jgi:hypothetical protein